MILVTGAAGSVGRALCLRLGELGLDLIETDLETMDVTNEQQVRLILTRKQPDVIFHLAGAKHAPEGELDPWHVANVNAVGTRNVLEHHGNAKVILASTCKACDPETAYGASKLIAERMVLNAGGVVVRFYNIPEADGNVFRLWEQIPGPKPLPVTDCWRYFTTLERSVDLLLAALVFSPGRYAVDPGEPHWIPLFAELMYPNRKLVRIPRRRGDREREPLHAASESVKEVNGYLKITSPHDPSGEEASEVAA